MPNIGMNLWVTAASDQGGRKYMEDVFDVKFDRKTGEDEARYAYFGVFDGHGGAEAANFAKKYLLKEITKNEGFWCEDDDEKVLNAISEGFKSTHKMMWNALGTWPMTAHGYPSTSGCTASVIFIRRSKMYVGHVGDSGVVLGTEDSDGNITADYITEDHKPENREELDRITECGGQVLVKKGVSRVVWDRPRKPCQGPLRRSTQIDHIPFLAVSRALGDLWSYNPDNDMFVVSPEPDVRCIKLDPTKHKHLVLASDGLWHIMKPQDVSDFVKTYSQPDDDDDENSTTANELVQYALRAWHNRSWRADNISVIIIEMDPPDLENGTECVEMPLASRASSVSTLMLDDEYVDDYDDDDKSMRLMKFGNNDNNSSPRVTDYQDDLPRSTSGTPEASHVMPFSPFDECVATKQPFSLFRMITSKKSQKKLKGNSISMSFFDGDDQDSRDTGTYNKLKLMDVPKRASKLADTDHSDADHSPVNTNNSASLSLSSHLKQGKRKLPPPAYPEENYTSGCSQLQQNIGHRDSREGASCSKGDQSDTHSGASQGISPSSQVYGASSGPSKVSSQRTARQVGLNLTNSTATSSSLSRWPLETPAGWTSIKGADQEQQVTACSAMGSEIAAGTWPESLDLGTSSLADPIPTDASSSCFGVCEYAPENPLCKKCHETHEPIKKALKRKTSPPISQIAKRFRSSCTGGHRTRSTLNRIRALHSRSSRKAAST